MIQRKGVKALTLREIAKQARVSHAAPYRHFKNKADLLTAVAVQGFDMLVRETRERFTEIPDHPLFYFRESGLAYIDFAIAHPSHFRVMFGLGEERKKKSDELRRASGESFSILFDSIERCQAAGAVRAGDPRELALSAWSIVHGFAMLYIEGYIKKFDEAENRRIKQMVVDSLYLGLRVMEEGQAISHGGCDPVTK